MQGEVSVDAASDRGKVVPARVSATSVKASGPSRRRRCSTTRVFSPMTTSWESQCGGVSAAREAWFREDQPRPTLPHASEICVLLTQW